MVTGDAGLLRLGCGHPQTLEAFSTREVVTTVDQVRA